VLLDAKLRWRQPTEIISTTRNVKGTIALLALKMMMMSFVCALVSSRLSRYFNRFNRTIGEQHADCAVDCRDAEAFDSP
jgi:hypothetical protein